MENERGGCEKYGHMQSHIGLNGEKSWFRMQCFHLNIFGLQ